jgi:hypothetical protein
LNQAGAGAIAVSLAPTRAQPSPMFHAITERQSTRGDFDGSPAMPLSMRRPVGAVLA